MGRDRFSTSVFGKHLEMYKVGFFVYAIGSHNGPLSRRLPICNPVSIVHELGVARSSSVKVPDPRSLD